MRVGRSNPFYSQTGDLRLGLELLVLAGGYEACLTALGVPEGRILERLAPLDEAARRFLTRAGENRELEV